MTSLDLTLHLPASAIEEGAGELAIAATAHVPAEVDEQDLVIAPDPLGVRDSGRPPDGTLCSYEARADAAEGATHVLRARLSEGTLADGLAPVGSATIIGVGHSIGGGLVVLQQAPGRRSARAEASSYDD